MVREQGTNVRRARWAAVGAAVATAVGGGSLMTASAEIDSGDRPVLISITPCRIADTRPGSDNVGARLGALTAGETYSFMVRGSNGNCVIPNDALGVVMNLAAILPSASSFFTMFPSDATRPLSANLNFVGGQAPVSNAVAVKLSNSGATAGQVSIFNLAGSVHFTADIVGYFVGHNHDDRYYTEAELDARQWTNANIADGTIATADLADESVTSAKIVDGTIATSDLADNSVTSAKIVNGTVANADLANNSVNSAKIVDGTIGTGDLADGAVDSAKILDESIGANDLGNNSVGFAEIQTDGVQASEIADNSIDSGEIVDFTLTNQDVGVLFAEVSAAGVLDNQCSGCGVTVLKLPGSGNYEVDFGRNVTSSCTAVATVGPSGGGSALGEVNVADRGGNPEAIFVDTNNSDGTAADRPFRLVVVC